MTRPWRRFLARLIAPSFGLWLFFVAIRDGFIRQEISFSSSRTSLVYEGSEAILVGLALLAGAAWCGFLTYRYWFLESPLGPD